MHRVHNCLVARIPTRKFSQEVRELKFISGLSQGSKCASPAHQWQGTKQETWSPHPLGCAGGSDKARR